MKIPQRLPLRNSLTFPSYIPPVNPIRQINQRHILWTSLAFRIPNPIYNFASFPQATLTDPTVAKWEGETGSFHTNPPSCTYAVTKFPQYLAVSSDAPKQVGTHTHMSSKARLMALMAPTNGGPPCSGGGAYGLRGSCRFHF